MPIISIKEYDLTKAGNNTSTSFSVVVPGFVRNSGKIKDKDVFDENGIYECSSQADFVTAVGQIPADTTSAPGKGPTLVKFGETGDKTGIYSHTITSLADYQNYIGTLYTRKEAAAGAEEGYLIGYDPNDKEKTGSLYEYTKVDETAASFNPVGTSYIMILPGNEGYNKVENVNGHMGNQIAYYLLGLGYTVLYKRLNKTTTKTNGKKAKDEVTGIKLLLDPDFWEPLKDKSAYDFRYIIAGMKSDLEAGSEKVTMGEVDKQMLAIANFINTKSIEETDDNGRGDVIVLCEIPQNAYVNNNITYTPSQLVDNILAAKTTASTYAPYFVPSVTYAGTDSIYNNTEFPAAFHYLACASLAFQNYNEWYAVAGYTRGISPYVVASLPVKLGDKAINKLQPRNSSKGGINVVTCIKGNYYLWGNRTGEPSKNEDLTAQNFLNIRQLCATLKKVLWTNCRRFTFDPNSDTLWVNFCNSITPTLEKMKADQGIRAYKIVKVATDRKATLKAIVRIVPIEAVEDFDLTITLEDSVAGILTSFGEE